MNIKEHVEGNAILYVLGMLVTGFLGGISASGWMQKNQVAALETTIKFKDTQIKTCETKAIENAVDCFKKYQKKIHIMNTATRGETIVAKIKWYLNEVQNFHSEGVFVMLESLENVKEEASKIPDLLIVHRHAFQEKKDDLLFQAIATYKAKNDKINILIFSESFLNKDTLAIFENKLDSAKLRSNVKTIGVNYRKSPDRSGQIIRNLVLSMMKE